MLMKKQICMIPGTSYVRGKIKTRTEAARSKIYAKTHLCKPLILAAITRGSRTETGEERISQRGKEAATNVRNFVHWPIFGSPSFLLSWRRPELRNAIVDFPTQIYTIITIDPPFNRILVPRADTAPAVVLYCCCWCLDFVRDGKKQIEGLLLWRLFVFSAAVMDTDTKPNRKYRSWYQTRKKKGHLGITPIPKYTGNTRFRYCGNYLSSLSQNARWGNIEISPVAKTAKHSGPQQTPQLSRLIRPPFFPVMVVFTFL